MAVKANTAPPDHFGSSAGPIFIFFITLLLIWARPRRSAKADDRKRTLTVSARCRGRGLLMRQECVSGLVVCERSTTEGLLLSGNKDMIKSCLETDATRERLKNRFGCFFVVPFQSGEGLPLSCPPARSNCVTDISYTRFLTSVHLTIQPARRYRAPRRAFPTPRGSVPDARHVRPG